MSSDVKYIYTNNISNINQIEQGSFVYNITDQRLYLCTPEGAGNKSLAAVGRSIIYTNSLEDIEAYQNNEIYLTQDGKLYYYHRDVNTNPQEIASVKALENVQKDYQAADSALQKQIGYRTHTDSEGTKIPAIGLNKDIEDINNIIGEAGGTAGREATGLYKIIFDLDGAQKSSIQELDNKKVDIKTFEDTLKNYSTTEDLNTDLENNYYTKTEAKDLFLSANEELFLTEGVFIANCEYAEINDRYVLWDNNFTDVEKLVGPCIVLTIKNNSTDTDQEELQINTIVIPAIDLVDVYKGSSATNDSNIDVDVSNYIVSANVNVDNLIGSTDNDTVKLSNNEANKIIASFKTENIVDSTTAGKNVSLSVGDDNKISAQIEIDNLIKNTSGSLVTLEKNDDGKTMSVLLDSSVSNAIKRIGDINDIEDSVETLTETLSQYGISNLATNETEYQLKDGLITQAIKIEADKIAKLNEDFVEYKDNHETEFNTHKQAFEDYKTTNNSNITKIGSYQYNTKTDDKEAEAIVSNDTYFAEVKEHIEAETANVRQSLNNATIELNKEISDLKTKDGNIDTSISTLESWVGSIYQVKDENGNNLANPTGILAQEILDREQSDADLNDKIDSLYKIETVTNEAGETSTSITGTIHDAITAVQSNLDIKHQALTAEDERLEQLIEDLAGDSNTSTVATNAFAISELQAKINNDTSGLEKAHDKVNNLTAAANRAYEEEKVTAEDGNTISYSLKSGYIKDYIDAKASELQQADTGLSGRISDIEKDYQTKSAAEINFKKTTVDNGTDISYTGDIVTAYTAADTALENKINGVIAGLSTGAIKTNTDKIKNLKDNFDKAISLTKATDSDTYSLTGGIVKAYVDAVDGKVGELDTAYKSADKALTIKTIECGLYKLNDSNAIAENGKEKHSLKITFENNDTAYYPLGDYIKNNYYTKTEANSAFLGADKDLFLTSGEVLKGTYDTGTKEFTEDNEDGTWHIILTLRDLNDKDNTPGEQIVVPVDSLITYYTEENAENAPVTISINGFKISADLSQTVKDQLNQVDLTKENGTAPAWNSALTGTTLADKVNSLPSHVSANYATKTSIDDLFKKETSGQTTSYKGVIGEIITTINSNIDDIEIALTDKGDIGQAIKANADKIAGVGTYSYNDTSQVYTATASTSFGTVNKHINEVADSVTTLSDSIGSYGYTKAPGETLGTATGSTHLFVNVETHINDLERYVDDKDKDLDDRIDADEKALKDYKTAVGTITLENSAYSLSESGYIKLLNDKLSGEINDLETGAVAENTGSIGEINTLLNAYGLVPKNTENKYVLSADGVVTAAIAANTTAIGVNADAIATNVTAIAANATDIADNATAIVANATAIDTKMSKKDPSGTGSFSLNRKFKTVDDIGAESVAMGLNTFASGKQSVAMGSDTVASGNQSYAGGLGTIADTPAMYAIGQYNQTIPKAYELLSNSSTTRNLTPGTSVYNFYGVDISDEGRITYISSSPASITEYDCDIDEYFYLSNSPTKTIFRVQSIQPNRRKVTNADGSYEWVIDYWTVRYHICEVEEDSNKHALFVIGDGASDTNRSNAFTILKDGEAHFTNTVYIDEANQKIPLFKSSGGEIRGNVTIASTTGAVKNDTTATGALIVNGGVVVKEKVIANQVYGSVWNDYAEYRQTHHKVRPGQCVYEKGDGSLAISYERMMPGANIVSDTFGFAIGETDKCKTPLAVSGRVLAYPYESKETYNPGDAVCSGPNGTISKMTRAEIRDYPERIVGTVSEIPTYEVWGSGNIKVNGRIWIKVK